MTSERTVLLVICSLAMLAIMGLLMVFLLIKWGVEADRVAILVAIVGPSAGALSTMLASTRSVSPSPTAEEASPEQP